MNNRNSSIDLMRICAIFLVVLCHATEWGIYVFSLEDLNACSDLERWFVQSIFSISKVSVPIFLFITGYLMLDRIYDIPEVISFWKGKWLRLLLLTQIWFLIYDIFLKYVMKDPTITMKSLVKHVLFLQSLFSSQRPVMTHTWYMPVIIGMYMLIPFASIAVNRYRDIIHLPLGFFFMIFFIIPSIAVILRAAKGVTSITPQINGGFSGGVYGVYIITGQVVRIYENKLKKIKTIILFLAALFFLQLTIGTQFWSYSKNVLYNISNDSAFLFLTALCVFLIGLKVDCTSNGKIVYFLSANAFGVYLVHMIFKYLLLDQIKGVNTPRLAQVFILWILLMVLSYIAVYLIRKIPKVGDWMVYTTYRKDFFDRIT